MTHMTEALTLPSRPDEPDTARHFRVGHNRAIQAYARDQVGAANDLRHSERAILSLIAGLDQWIGSNAYDIDPYSGEFVVFGVAQAINNALNLDLGRLDGGALSSYVHDLCRRANVDPNTGEWR